MIHLPATLPPQRLAHEAARARLSSNTLAVLDCVASVPRPVTTAGIVQSTGLDRKLVGVIVLRLVKANMIRKISRGTFTL